MLEIAIALRRQELQVDALDETPAVDAHLLGRHTHPGMALRGQVPVKEPPVRGRVDAGRHVVPLDHGRTAEPVRLDGTSHHESGSEWGLGAQRHLPAPVFPPLALQFVGDGPCPRR